MDSLCEHEQGYLFNETLLNSFKGAETEYRPVGSVVQMDVIVLYPVEFLNTFNQLSSPQASPQSGGSSDASVETQPTQTLQWHQTANEGPTQERHQGYSARGESVFMPLIASENPFEFKRPQFPLKVCFAVTINKSQGQTLKVAGIDLTDDCLSHGQFYVAYSRVSSPSSVVILAPQDRTSNVVYREVRQ